MNYEIGSIVCLKHIIFKNRINDKYTNIDHAHKRPCIIIAEDEDYTYFLHFKSEAILKKEYLNSQYYYGEKSNNNIGGYIMLESIHKRNICYREEIAKAPDKKLLEILETFCYFQENIKQDEEYQNIKHIIYDKIEELKKSQKERTKVLSLQKY